MSSSEELISEDIMAAVDDYIAGPGYDVYDTVRFFRVDASDSTDEFHDFNSFTIRLKYDPDSLIIDSIFAVGLPGDWQTAFSLDTLSGKADIVGYGDTPKTVSDSMAIVVLRTHVYTHVSGTIEFRYCEASDAYGHPIVNKVSSGSVILSINEDSKLPEKPTILDIAPNPFNNSCEITVSLCNNCRFYIEDISGRKIAAFHIKEGTSKFIWKPKSDSPSAVYFGVLYQNDSVVDKRRITLIK